MHYRVMWEIDVDTNSPAEAAREALRIQRDTESWATVFTVNGPDGVTTIDLGE